MRLDRLLMAGALLALLTGCVSSTGGLRRSADDQRENAARIHTELGQGYMARGQLETALSKLQTALRFDPDYAPAHTLLGVLYERIGRLEKAENHYRHAVQLKPTDGATNNNFGVFLCKEGKTDEAMPYFTKALDDPFYKTPAAAWTNAGTCQIKAGNYKEAEADFRKALGINSRFGDALYQMSRALYSQDDAFHARAFMQRYVALGRPDAAALLLAYRIETRLGNAEGAQDYARQLRTLFPDSEQAHALDTQSSQ